MIIEKELSDLVIKCAFTVYNELGNGFLEKIYEQSLLHELRKNNISCGSQVPVKVYYDGIIVGDYFVDILVENKIILELKTCENIFDVHIAQLINYLKATRIKLGYLLNFGHASKLEFKRIVY